MTALKICVALLNCIRYIFVIFPLLPARGLELVFMVSIVANYCIQFYDPRPVVLMLFCSQVKLYCFWSFCFALCLALAHIRFPHQFSPSLILQRIGAEYTRLNSWICVACNSQQIICLCLVSFDFLCSVVYLAVLSHLPKPFVRRCFTYCDISFKNKKEGTAG